MANRNRWTSRKISISRKYDESERKAIAFDIIEYIKSRTKRGKGKGNRKWSPASANKYTKGYRESLDFKFKADKSKVNITLTGDTLDEIDLLSESKGEIIYGISDSSPDHGKAEGNIRGSYGKPSGSRKKARDFLALEDKEVQKILKKYPTKKEKRRSAASLAADIVSSQIVEENIDVRG